MPTLRLLDLCCGLGGWSIGFADAGWDCTGIDLADFSRAYPGTFIRADILHWAPSSLFDFCVASTPCDEFARESMPWCRTGRPPSLTLWHRAWEIGRLFAPGCIQENVRGAQRWVGRSTMNCGPYHFWGDVPALVPTYQGKAKSAFSSSQAAERAVIPYEVSYWFGTVLRQAALLTPR